MYYMESPIPVRIPVDILAKIDAEGKRGTVVNRILRKHYQLPLQSYAVERVSSHLDSLRRVPPSERVVIHNLARNNLRPGHDPKTCKVYKCGMCAAVKA